MTIRETTVEERRSYDQAIHRLIQLKNQGQDYIDHKEIENEPLNNFEMIRKACIKMKMYIRRDN